MVDRVFLCQRTQNLISETIAGESIIIDLEVGLYYRAHGPASVLWDALKQGGDLDGLRETARSRDLDLGGAEIARFVLRLIDMALIACESDGRAALEAVAATALGTSPDLVLERYDDMADLLLMDPVHDVGEQGWPARPGGPGRPSDIGTGS